MIIKGISASRGIALARFIILEQNEVPDYTVEKIQEGEVQSQLAKLEEAINAALKNFEQTYHKALSCGDDKQAEIINAQKMLAGDAVLQGAVRSKIEGKHMSAEGALQEAVKENAGIFENMKDAYFKERAQDIRDAGKVILNEMLGIKPQDYSELPFPVIIIADELTPSELTNIDKSNLMGIIMQKGGAASHTAIIAKSLGIPAVLGCENAIEEIKKINDDAYIAVDGKAGTVEIGLTEERYSDLQKKIKINEDLRQQLGTIAKQDTITSDGVKIHLNANISHPDEIESVLAAGADGIGLFRTEFLFMNSKESPGEEEQFKYYKQAAFEMKDKDTIIRTIDIGGDKPARCIDIEKEDNPFLGYRAIRVCLDKPELFMEQLRAILRASAFGSVSVMFPMISSLEELRASKELLNRAKEELRERKCSFDENIKVGMMIEVPSAALMSEVLIKEADFFSIGSNDLAQYVLAADRSNQNLGNLYNHFNPGVIRLISQVIDAAEKHGKPAGICGEMASDPRAVLLLIGLGLRKLSVGSASLLIIRKLIKSIDTTQAKKTAKKILGMTTAEEIETFLDSKMPVWVEEAF